ncbi:hypothetical protein KH5_06650 [Urechidicola sp. KH5]
MNSKDEITTVFQFDPLFVNVAAYNFYFTAISSAIHAITASGFLVILVIPLLNNIYQESIFWK